MKLFKTYLVTALVLLLASCNNALDEISGGVLPGDEMISLGVDTFHVQAENVFADYIYSRSDSFLLGNYQDDEFGNTRAEILAQFAAPEGYQYPDSAELDSVCIYLYYMTGYGYPQASMHVKAYEMDLNTFSYSKRYPSNINPADYCSKNTLLAEQFASAIHPHDSIANSNGDYVYYISLRMDKQRAQQFFERAKKGFSSQTEFCNYFKGIYFTTDFGSSTMFYISQIDLTAYYHYSYTYTDINGEKKTQTNKDSKTYPANSEVRQVNVFTHSDRQQVIERLNKVDSLCYISSPANIYTCLHIPTQQMLTKIQSVLGNKRPYVSGARMVIDLVDVDTNAMSSASDYMLLVKQSAMDRFFDKKESTNDTCAILGSLSYTTDSAGTTITGYQYVFDLSGFLNAKLREMGSGPASYLLYDTTNGCTNWVLVPVEIESTSTSSSTTVTAVKHMYTMSATRIRNGMNPLHPLRINLVYSGF